MEFLQDHIYAPKLKSSIIDPRATNLRSNTHGNSATATRTPILTLARVARETSPIGSTWF